MKTLEQKQNEIMERARAEMENAEKECNLLALLKIQPKYIHLNNLYKSSGTICYEATKKKQVLDIYDSFTVLPSFLCKTRSGTSVKCFDDEQAQEVTEFLACVEIDTYRTELKFFTEINGNVYRVAITVPVHWFGNFYRSDNRAKINYKMLFNPKGEFNCLHRICKYASAEYRGPNSFGQEIWAMYENYEIDNLFERGEV